MIESPHIEPINWHDWKDVLVRIGIPIGIAVTIGYLTITTMIDCFNSVECMSNTNWGHNNE